MLETGEPASADRRADSPGATKALLGVNEVVCRDLSGEARWTQESRHLGPVFPLSRYGPAGSSATTRNADRAVLYDVT